MLPSQHPVPRSRGGGGGGSDRTSDYSFDGSATDSEREHQHPLQEDQEPEDEEDDEEDDEEGEEEEEEEDELKTNHHPRERHLPPPPPPPRGSFWLQQQQQQLQHHHQPLKQSRHQRPSHNHPTVRFKELNSTEDEDGGGEDPTQPRPSSHRQRLISRLTSTGVPTARTSRRNKPPDALAYPAAPGDAAAAHLLHQQRSASDGNDASSGDQMAQCTMTPSLGRNPTCAKTRSQNPDGADDSSASVARHRNGGVSGKFSNRADVVPTTTTTTTTDLIDDDEVMLKEVTV